MMKKYKNIILWILTTAGWTILTLLLSKGFSISKGYSIEDALVFIPFAVIVVGLLLIMGRGYSRNPVEFTTRSHQLFSASKTDELLTNNHGKRYGYDYNWKCFFNGYSILIAGALCILIGITII